jgi:flagellar capping protein FliD
MPTDQDEKDTLPPGAVTEMRPPAGIYADAVVDDLLATAKRLEGHYQTLLDPQGLLTQQTAAISKLIDTNYGLIHNEVIGIRGTLDALAPRVTKTEERLDSLDQLRSEFVSMQERMSQIEAALGLRAQQ